MTDPPSEFRAIPSYPDYFISLDGRVYSRRRRREISVNRNRVNINGRSQSIDRLLYETLFGQAPRYMRRDHREKLQERINRLREIPDPPAPRELPRYDRSIEYIRRQDDKLFKQLQQQKQLREATKQQHEARKKSIKQAAIDNRLFKRLQSLKTERKTTKLRNKSKK